MAETEKELPFGAHGFQPPPWTPTPSVLGDHLIDILPSGRPGVVLYGVPKKLARKLILTANSFSR